MISESWWSSDKLCLCSSELCSASFLHDLQWSGQNCFTEKALLGSCLLSVFTESSSLLYDYIIMICVPFVIHQISSGVKHHWESEERHQKSPMLITGRHFSLSVLVQDTDPQTAPDKQASTLHGSSLQSVEGVCLWMSERQTVVKCIWQSHLMWSSCRHRVMFLLSHQGFFLLS